MRDSNKIHLSKTLSFTRGDIKKLLLVLLPCFVMTVLLVLFSRGYLILGAEGNYITDFQNTKEIGTYAWVPLIYGTGFPTAVFNNLVGIFGLFAFLQNIGFSFKTVNIISALLAYILPFLSMLWLLRRMMKVNFLPAYLISLFYILNPLSVYHFQSLMFWNIAPLFFFPLVFGCIYKYYTNPIRLFLFFGLLTAALSFALSNIPYLGVFHILVGISVIIIPFVQNIKFGIKRIVKNFLILESSFILFNMWWLINLFRFVKQDLAGYYTKEFAIGWATAYTAGDNSLIIKLLSLTTRLSRGDISYFTNLYFNVLFCIILFIPFFLIIVSLIGGRVNIRWKKYSLAIIFSILMVIFLNKGVNEPFGNVFIWMLDNIPYFYIFKTPLEKFTPLLLLLVALALVPVFSNITKKWVYYLFAVYLIACSIPYFSLNFMPEYTMSTDVAGNPTKFVSKRYTYKEDYFDAIQAINKNKLDYRYVSTPGSGNYQETILNHNGNRYYRGMNPFLHATNKPFIAAYSAPTNYFVNSIFKNFSNDQVLEGLLNIYSVRKIVLNKDIYGSFGFIEPENADQLFDIFSGKYNKKESGPVTIFTRENYLPHFYTPQNIIHSNHSRNQLINLFSQPDYSPRSVYYFQDENDQQGNSAIKKLKINFDKNNLPVIEYKRINPAKYRVVIHRAKGEFPIVFSEGFHDGWNMYLGNSRMPPASPEQLKLYKILHGNENDQANLNNLSDYINQGLISTLGDGKEKNITHQKLINNVVKTDFIEEYSIGFISKNFYGTIQNENLPQGSVYETWFKKSIDNNNHVMANGYANSWILNTDTICSGESLCHQNADGTYDFEVIVEFWPERLLYLGLCISTVAFLISLSILLFFSGKKIDN